MSAEEPNRPPEVRYEASVIRKLTEDVTGNLKALPNVLEFIEFQTIILGETEMAIVDDSTVISAEGLILKNLAYDVGVILLACRNEAIRGKAEKVLRRILPGTCVDDMKKLKSE